MTAVREADDRPPYRAPEHVREAVARLLGMIPADTPPNRRKEAA